MKAALDRLEKSVHYDFSDLSDDELEEYIRLGHIDDPTEDEAAAFNALASRIRVTF